MLKILDVILKTMENYLRAPFKGVRMVRCIKEGKSEKRETHSEVSLNSYHNSSGEKGGNSELK